MAGKLARARMPTIPMGTPETLLLELAQRKGCWNLHATRTFPHDKLLAVSTVVPQGARRRKAFWATGSRDLTVEKLSPRRSSGRLAAMAAILRAAGCGRCAEASAVLVCRAQPSTAKQEACAPRGKAVSRANLVGLLSTVIDVAAGNGNPVSVCAGLLMDFLRSSGGRHSAGDAKCIR